jgi:hypothetical protein
LNFGNVTIINKKYNTRRSSSRSSWESFHESGDVCTAPVCYNTR